MEGILKILLDFIKATKVFWLVLLGAGIAIYSHYKTTKSAIERETRERKNQLFRETNKERFDALKQLYELVNEITSIYTIYMTKVKFKISRKQRDPLSDEIEELRLILVEYISKASMLVQFYAVEKSITFKKFQKTIHKGLGIWDAYQLVIITNDNFLHRLTKAHLELIEKNARRIRQYEFALTFRIGSEGRKIIRCNDLYLDELEQVNII